MKEQVANQVWQVNILNLVTEKSLVSGTTRSKLSDILFLGIDLCQGRQKRRSFEPKQRTQRRNQLC